MGNFLSYNKKEPSEQRKQNGNKNVNLHIPFVNAIGILLFFFLPFFLIFFICFIDDREQIACLLAFDHHIQKRNVNYIHFFFVFFLLLKCDMLWNYSPNRVVHTALELHGWYGKIGTIHSKHKSLIQFFSPFEKWKVDVMKRATRQTKQVGSWKWEQESEIYHTHSAQTCSRNIALLSSVVNVGNDDKLPSSKTC